jgi:hypothetical protein
MDRLGLYVNKIYVGLLAGLIGPWFGFFLFYLITSFDQTMSQFVDTVTQNSDTYSGVISICSIFNLGIFFLALNRNYVRAAQGVIFATLTFSAVVVYFKYLA